jgi:hypothetical protein
MSEEMGLIERIDALQDRLNGKEPEWVRGFKSSKRDNHLSGALREMADEVMSNPDISLDDIEMNIRELLEEAAETLDEAHEEWLNTQLAARDLAGDIGALRCDDPRDESLREEPTEHWFGGFHPSWDDDSCVEIQTYVEWPNLGITVDALTAVLRGEEYKL